MGVSGVSLEKDKIIDAIYKKKGIIEHAASSLGCSPAAIYEWRKKDSDVALAIKDAREKKIEEEVDDNLVLCDLARKSARLKLQEFDTTTTIFILKSLGGFNENSTPSTLNINLLDNPFTDA